VWAVRHYFVVAAGHVFIASFGTTRPERDARLVDALAAGFELIGSPPGAAADPPGLESRGRVRHTVVDRDTRQRFAAYSLRARQVVLAAREEALRRGRAAVDQQDLLCGVAVVESSAGLDILAGLGVSQARLRHEAELAFPPDPEAAERGNDAGGDGEGAPLHFAGGAERTLAAAEAEARVLGHGYVGVEHLLLGLVTDGTGSTSELLTRLGASPGATRVAVHQLWAVR
jgi:hypothetical protein